MVGLSSLQPVAALTPAELFARVSPAVWMVQADHAAPGAGAGGSAVAIDARTLATNAHVVNGATTIRVTHDAGKTIIPVAQVTRDPDPARDLCLLAVSEDLPGEPVEHRPGRERRRGRARLRDRRAAGTGAFADRGAGFGLARRRRRAAAVDPVLRRHRARLQRRRAVRRPVAG